MKATHTDYLHPGHLRVEDGKPHMAWSIPLGFYDQGAMCVSPSCSDYDRLNRAGLPRWTKNEAEKYPPKPWIPAHGQ